MLLYLIQNKLTFSIFIVSFTIVLVGWSYSVKANADKGCGQWSGLKLSVIQEV